MSLQAQIAEVTAAATAAQRLAYNPEKSVWLSASAGTGKTYVLIRRLLRLFLHDPLLKPADVLALTFTKAAAREMEERFVGALVAWSSASSEELTKELTTLLERAPTGAEISRASTLLTTVLDSEPPITITTLHAFAGQVISRFPLESDLYPGSQILDEEEQRTLLEQALQSTFELLGTRKENEEPHWAFVCLAERMAESTLRDVFTDFIHNARRYKNMFATGGGFAGVLETLKQDLNDALKEPELWPVQKEEALGTDSPHAEALQSLCARMLKSKGKTDVQRGQALAAFLEANTISARAAVFERYAGAFLTKTKTPVKSFASKQVSAALSIEELDAIEAETQRVLEVYEFCAAGDTFVDTQAYLLMSSLVLNAYEKLKKEHAQIDHDDLIDALVSLLNDPENRDWVLYRLDQRYKHVMVDEAQDTDTRQWHIVRAILSEFFTEGGSHEEGRAPRTFFTVGDMKQSIYRFRGAEPEVFLAMRNYLQEVLPEDPTVSMKTSFRSGAAVLESVDMLLSDERFAYYAASGGETHGIQRLGVPGRIEIHPLVSEEQEKANTDMGWILPEERPLPTNKYTPLGRYVAGWVNSILADAPILPSTGKRATASDIMVLLKSRTMMPELIAALDAAGIAHSGADVMSLKDVQFVQDMLAVLSAALNIQNQLAHLQVLRSPLWHMDAQFLESVKEDARENNLWYRLNQDDRYVDYVAWIQDVRRALSLGCEAALQFIIRSRKTLGAYAACQNVSPQVIDSYWGELLKLARTADKKSISVSQFVHESQNRSTNVKRAEGASAGVRLMTVHGSKGLEAPIVILPDTTSAVSVSREKVFWDHESRYMLLGQNQESRCRLQARMQEEELERMHADSMKLLYVAMTRAEDRLMVCGTSAREKDAESWYKWLMRTVENHEGAWQKDENGVYVYDKVGEVPLAPVAHTERAAKTPLPSVPTPKQERMKPRVKPSATQAFDAEKILQDTPDPKDFARGAFVHKCLEHLPNLAGDKKAGFLTCLKEQSAHLLSHPVMDASIVAVEEVIARYGEFFGPSSRAEVPFRVMLKEGLVSGVMDRVMITETHVHIIDYKTAHRFPRGDADMMARYQAQVSLYKKAMQALYPDKIIEASLLWITEQGIRLDSVDSSNK